MKPGYVIEHLITDKPNIIEVCNYTGLNIVKLYGWFEKISGTTENTVAIFKIKYK